MPVSLDRVAEGARLFAVVGDRRVLHEGGMLLANIRVYSTGVGVSCSMDNPWPVQPHLRAVAGLKGPRPETALSERNREPSGTIRSQAGAAGS